MTELLVPHPDDKSPLAEKAAIKTAKHVSESGHWYDRAGNQIQEVPSADGKKMVKCTLRHARQLDLARGITSIIGAADKPALTNWLTDQAILSALTLPRTSAQTEAEWLSLVKEDMRKRSEEAAAEGTRIHAALQSHFQGESYDPAYKLHVEGVLRVLPTQQGGNWRTEVGLASPRGYGTKLDLVNDRFLLDLKSKDGDQHELDNMKLYDDHDMQLIAGAQAIIEGFEPASGKLGCNHRECGIVFVSRTHPGVASLHWVPEERLWRAWEMFQGLLAYVHAKDQHRPFKGGM